MSKTESKELLELCEFDKDLAFCLVYKGTKDGFKPVNFHKKCDHLENTLTIVQTTDNFVFGGYVFKFLCWDFDWFNNLNRYTTQNWSGSGDKIDSNAFIFSFINKDKKPIKIKCHPNRTAIQCNKNYGPMFGLDDFCIADQFCQNDSDFTNFTSLGFSYEHPAYAYGSTYGDRFLAGSNQFDLSEIEIYHIE